MFVDEKAEGEPYLPEKPDSLPWRYPFSVVISLSVALFCYDAWLDNVIIPDAAAAELWWSIESLAIAFAAGIGIVGWVHARLLRSVKISPPF